MPVFMLLKFVSFKIVKILAALKDDDNHLPQDSHLRSL